MANSSVNLINLDFDSLKDNFKIFLKSQDKFKDYDFDGSNMNVLLDVMSYNTYLNSFYLNMVASEMFLDTAQLRDSVISHAKELNYLPRSFKSAEAVVNVRIDTGSPVVTSLTIPKGTTFSTRVGSNSFSFSTNKNIVLTGSDGVFNTGEISIYEGEYINETFVIDYAQSNQRFLISNPTVDVDSMTVSVIEDNGGQVLEYSYRSSLFGVQSDTRAFFLQAAENEKFEILFGDGITGRRPKDGSVVVVDYRVTSGELPNGSFKFSTDGPIESYSNVVVTTVTPALGGAVSESMESIRFNAPRHFTIQERAITTNDYETLLKMNYPEINAVSAYGGENENPPQYGRVFIAVDITDVEGLPDSKLKEYYRFVKERSPISIEPVFKDPEFTYVNVNTVVNYNIEKTDLDPSDIRTLTVSAINKYNTDNLNNFKRTLRYSRLLDVIDGSHPSIISNETTLRAIKVIKPKVNTAQNISIKFDFALLNDVQRALPRTHSSTIKRTIESNAFTFRNRQVIIEDNGAGALVLAAVTGAGTYTIIKTIGTVDYNTGTLSIQDLNPSQYPLSGIKIYARPKSNDVFSTRNNILTIRNEDINVDAVRTKATSDSNYTESSISDQFTDLI
jgi:hypothetical protein